MSHKSGKIAALLREIEPGSWSRHYIGFFACFNRGLYYEAHDVLEEIWLPARKGPRDAFYKGLIQLAGAFVHFQKERLRPAGALLRLADENLSRYPAHYDGIDTGAVRGLIREWLDRLDEGAGKGNPFLRYPAPVLVLPEGNAGSG